MEPGYVRDRHAGLHRLLDQPDLLLGTVSLSALPAGDDFDALDGLRHRRTPMLPPGPHCCATCPVELGAAPDLAAATLSLQVLKQRVP